MKKWQVVVLLISMMVTVFPVSAQSEEVPAFEWESSPLFWEAFSYDGNDEGIIELAEGGQRELDKKTLEALFAFRNVDFQNAFVSALGSNPPVVLLEKEQEHWNAEFDHTTASGMFESVAMLSDDVTFQEWIIAQQKVWVALIGVDADVAMLPDGRLVVPVYPEDRCPQITHTANYMYPESFFSTGNFLGAPGSCQAFRGDVGIGANEEFALSLEALRGIQTYAQYPKPAIGERVRPEARIVLGQDFEGWSIIAIYEDSGASLAGSPAVTWESWEHEDKTRFFPVLSYEGEEAEYTLLPDGRIALIDYSCPEFSFPGSPLYPPFTNGEGASISSQSGNLICGIEIGGRTYEEDILFLLSVISYGQAEMLQVTEGSTVNHYVEFVGEYVIGVEEYFYTFTTELAPMKWIYLPQNLGGAVAYYAPSQQFGRHQISLLVDGTLACVRGCYD